MRHIALIAFVVAAAGCGGGSSSALPTGSEPVTLDPADFTTEITNQYWPMAPGDRWVYRETDGEGGEQKVEVTVTDRTKTIDGIEARVVHDVVTEDGEVIEDTLRLVRAGRRREHLVPRRGHERVSRTAS